jgi:small subunit ribosomal protein S1
VLDVDSKAKRISLGLKQLEPDPWTLFTQKYNPGDKVEGLVRSLTDYGVFVGIEDGVDGMVHKSDISWTQRVNHPSELFQKDDKVEAIILNINHDEKKVSLGIKQLYDDPWERIPRDYPPGRTLDVTVMKVTDFGAFVEIEKGIEGLIHVSELRDERVDDPRTVVAEGQTVKAEIISVDPHERRIGLSMKSAASRAEYSEAMGYLAAQAPTPRRSGTLGDLIQSKLGDKVADLPPGPGSPATPAKTEE